MLGLLTACVEPTGSIASGQKFGISVGMPPNSASAILRQRGFEPVLSVTNDEITECGGRLRGKAEEVSAFSNVRGPIICLFVMSDRVAAIAWEYTMP